MQFSRKRKGFSRAVDILLTCSPLHLRTSEHVNSPLIRHRGDVNEDYASRFRVICAIPQELDAAEDHQCLYNIIDLLSFPSWCDCLRIVANLPLSMIFIIASLNRELSMSPGRLNSIAAQLSLLRHLKTTRHRALKFNRQIYFTLGKPTSVKI